MSTITAYLWSLLLQLGMPLEEEYCADADDVRCDAPVYREGSAPEGEEKEKEKKKPANRPSPNLGSQFTDISNGF